MKYRKYIVALLLVVAIAVLIAHLYRDSIARKVANSALRGQNLTVIDVAIDSIDTSYVHFRELILEQGDGTRILVSGISLPTNARGPQPGAFSISGVELAPIADAGPASPAVLIQSFLDAPAAAPKAMFHVGRFLMPGVPELTNIVWAPGESGQALRFDIEGYGVDLSIERLADLHHVVIVSVRQLTGQRSITLPLQLFRMDSGFSISAEASIPLGPLLPLLHSADILPKNVTSLDARLAGLVSIEIPDDPSQTARAMSQLSADGDMSISYQLDGEQAFDLRVSLPDKIDATYEYPSKAWTAVTRSARLVIDGDVFRNFPVRFADIECQSGLRCTLLASVEASNVKYSNWEFASLQVSAPIALKIEEVTRIELLENTKITVSEATYAGYPISDVTLTEFSGASFVVDDSEWRGSAAEIQLRIDKLVIEEMAAMSFPLRLEDLLLQNSGENLEVSLAAGSSGSSLFVNRLQYVFPSIEGELAVKGDLITASLDLSSDDGGLSASIVTAHDLSSGAGSLNISDIDFDFATRKLSTYTSRWSNAWDVFDGAVSAETSISWTSSPDATVFDGTAEMSAVGLAANYNDLLVAGLDFDLSASIDSQAGHAIAPIAIDVALLDIGLPIEDIVAIVTPDLAEQTLHVDELSMRMLGGTIATEAFTYRKDAVANALLLTLQSVKLRLMLDLTEFESIDISGSMSGALPLTIANESVLIESGKLESDPGGGAIRYLPSGGIDAVDDEESHLGIVTRALGNFQYESLAADVSYSEKGDLKLQMRMEGINPDYDPDQPIILNLGVENNIPQLLRSLQATRSIQEILERKALQ